MRDQVLLTKIVIENKAGFWAEPENPEFFAEKIIWLLFHPEEARAMGRRGKERVYTFFSASRMAKEMVCVYEATLGLCGNFSPSR